jgi:pimeloyl-ACP methyl ester carboxylesterase
MHLLEKRGVKMMVVTLLVLLLIFGVFFIIVPPSSGKIKPFYDSNGNLIENSFAEKVFVEINGVKQGMIIKGYDPNLPLLLLVHGGPGLSDYFLSTIYETNIEKSFVICYWEQRGTGLSYDKNLDLNTMNKEQFISDTIAVSEYLKNRFHQEKIFIMGHSWGSYLALMAVKSNPELYHAYIAMSQVVQMIESEKEAFIYMKERYTEENNRSMIRKMNAFDPNQKEDLLKFRKSALRDQTMHELGVGTMHKMDSVITGLFFPSLRCRDYTITERFQIWAGKVFSRNTEMLYTIDDFDARIDAIDILVPIYFFAGIHDYTTSYQLQKDYYEKINAPIKGFYTFSHSAHSPLFEEIDFALQILKTDVLNLQVSLNDLN